MTLTQTEKQTINSNIELPSGKVFNLDRFVALLPNNTTDENRY